MCFRAGQGSGHLVGGPQHGAPGECVSVLHGAPGLRSAPGQPRHHLPHPVVQGWPAPDQALTIQEEGAGKSHLLGVKCCSCLSVCPCV